MIDQEKVQIVAEIFNVTIQHEEIKPGDLYFGQAGDNLFSLQTCKEIDHEKMLIIPTKEFGECFFIWNCVKVTRNKED